MADREKTIESLGYFIKNRICTPHLIPWDDIAGAVALLKEQEAVVPDTDSEGTCTCGNCGETVGYYPVGCNNPNTFCKFCPECGRKVKWDE